MSEVLHDPNGREIVREYKTSYWFDLRRSQPSPHARAGFPKTEDGSIDAVARLVMRGIIAKAQCTRRTTGHVLWTVKRGPRIVGTRLYQPIILKGDAE